MYIKICMYSYMLIMNCIIIYIILINNVCGIFLKYYFHLLYNKKL